MIRSVKLPTLPEMRALRRGLFITVLGFTVVGCGAAAPTPSAVTGTSVPAATGAGGSATAAASTAVSTVVPADSGEHGTACVDPATYAIVQKLLVPGADVQAVLTANKNTLLIGLAGMQPPDPVSAEWRDFMTSALSAGNTSNEVLYAGYLLNGEVVLTLC